MIEVGEGVGGKNPAPLNGKRSLDPGQMPGNKNGKTSNSAAAAGRLTARGKEIAHGTHTLF